MRSTSGPLDLAIEGDGFFQVTQPSGTTALYARGILHRDAQGLMVTTDGFPLEPQITIPPNATSISISKDGIVSAVIRGTDRDAAARHDRAGDVPESGRSEGAWAAICSPRRPRRESRRSACPAADSRGTLAQGFLEDSNVSVVEEMVNMILGQRAYEANSKVLKAADEMLSVVNALVR